MEAVTFDRSMIWAPPHPCSNSVHILFFSAILTNLLFLYQNMPFLDSFWFLSLLTWNVG